MSMDATHLGTLLERAAADHPGRVAVEDESGTTATFAELDRAADRLAARLARWGVGRGDRVGLWLPKGIEAVAAVHGILRAGAAYVPVDPSGPPARGAAILADAWVKAAIVGPVADAALRDGWPGPAPLPRRIVVGGEPTGPGDTSWRDVLDDDAPSPVAARRRPGDLAYILYTSGSTGAPKGVMLTHEAAFAFLDWCAATFALTPDDRVASHAPFHFDLSVFDLYASCRAGAALVLVGESLGRNPVRLARFLAGRRPSVWYSAPSVLALLAEHGGPSLPDAAPRLVLFAGEVFPIRPLRALRSLWPDSEFWNLYGPTETNVCTAFRLPAAIPEGRDAPFPIGGACPPARVRVVDDSGRDAPPGRVGELLVAGPGLLRGYFGRPDLTTAAVVVDDAGTRWYRTGDLAADDGRGCLSFHGRRDRLVKKRGHRIELGEIESALHRHVGVERAAVVARDDGAGVTITAFIAMMPGRKGSILAMKRHCSAYLPHIMIPDTITFVRGLPTTSTDKVDYQGLGALAGARPSRD